MGKKAKTEERIAMVFFTFLVLCFTTVANTRKKRGGTRTGPASNTMQDFGEAAGMKTKQKKRNKEATALLHRPAPPTTAPGTAAPPPIGASGVDASR